MCTGAESVVYEAILDGRKVAVKKPVLSTSEDLDKFHKELQLLWFSFFLCLFYLHFSFIFFINLLHGLNVCLLLLISKLDHPGLAKMVAAHAKPPNYMFFFEFYDSHNLSEKLHVEEWSPSVDQVLMIAVQLGIILTIF